MDQKGAPAAEAVFAEHIALADLFLFAANGRHIQPQLFKARGVEFLGVRKRGGALDLPAGGFERAAQHRGSAHEHAQAQQPHDQDEIPAFENVIEMRAVDKQIDAGIILRVIGQLASLRQQRTEAAAERHGGKQDIGKAHGAQDLKKSFHALFFCTKPPALPGGRHKWRLFLCAYCAPRIRLIAWLVSSSALSRQNSVSFGLWAPSEFSTKTKSQ